MKNIIIGTAGHIDHGKTALVRALTGIDADRLKEEKERGITIDLGFAHMDLQGIRFGFVDVPGHERFVKNMLAGVGGIDLVLLVIAADESIMPQTREHFDICRLLKIQSGLVVLTKKDLVDEEFLELVKEEVEDLVAGSFLEGAEIIPVSSKTGEGIEELKAALLRSVQKIKEKEAKGIFCLPIDRAFTMHGFGTVVTGTLISGQVAKEEEIEILPLLRRTRVRGLQVYGRATDRALAGQRTALNLHGLEVQELERGMVLAHPDILHASSMMDVKLNLLASAARPLKTLTKVRFHHGTSEIIARIALLGQDQLEPGASCYAQLRLEKPAVAIAGDTFIIRQFSPILTIGGGVILDNHPLKHKQTDKQVTAFLSTLENGGPVERVAAFVNQSAADGITEKNLVARLGLTRAGLQEHLQKLEKEKRIKVLARHPAYVIDMPAHKQLCQAVIAQVQEFHKSNPLLRGISKEELRERLFGHAPGELFKAVLEELAAAEKIALVEDIVAIFGREIALSPEEQRLKEDLEAWFASTHFEPPSLDDLIGKFSGTANPDKIKKLFYLLVKDKTLIKITDDFTFHAQAIAEIKNRLKERFAKGAKFGVGEFKDVFNISRKYAIPLLEYLDRERITRRVGNERIML
jgi:selenocysteine-specific elongation factor